MDNGGIGYTGYLTAKVRVLARRVRSHQIEIDYFTHGEGEDAVSNKEIIAEAKANLDRARRRATEELAEKLSEFLILHARDGISRRDLYQKVHAEREGGVEIMDLALNLLAGKGFIEVETKTRGPIRASQLIRAVGHYEGTYGK